MSVDEPTLEAHEYRQEQTRRRKRRHQQTLLSEATEAAHEAISVGDRQELEEIVEDVLAPLLGLEDADDVIEAEEHLASSGIDINGYPISEVLRYGASSADFGTLTAAVATIEEISRAMRHDISTLETEQDVEGLETTLGIRYLRAESAEGGSINVYNRDDDLRAILFAGSQGAGKTTARKTLLEDRIAAGHKVIDVIDFHKAENATYDIPSQDEDLNEWRSDLGLDVGFEEFDAPDVEILAPLTPGLSSSLVPIDQETGECSVKPFTIPASDLSYRQLVMLLAHTTKTHENYLKAAHQKLTVDGGDWTLRDVAEAVRNRTNAGEKVADRIDRSLETAQRKSFIRDEGADHRLDWRDLMADSGTVSAFTVHAIKEWSDKLLVVSYLLDKLYDTRNRMLAETRDLDEYPVLTLGLGELHTVAPRRKAEQDIESTIEGYMIDTLSDLFALMRHANIEIVADTQRFHQQLAPDVSTLFHEIYSFNGQKPDVRKIFQTRVDDTRPVADVSQYETGICALVSGNGYKLPIRFAPPRSHHLDAKRDGDGISFRSRHQDDVELEIAPWSSSIPERLSFGGHRTDLERFFEECVEFTEDPADYIYMDHLVKGYRLWRSDGDRDYQDQYIKRKLSDHFNLDTEGDRAYLTVVSDLRKGARRRVRFKPSAFDDADRQELFGDNWERRVWSDVDVDWSDQNKETAD